MCLNYGLGILFILMTIPVEGQLNWTNCEPKEFSDAIYVHELVIQPLPIRLPGEYNVTFDATVSRYVPELVIEVEIGWTNSSTRVTEKVYPLTSKAWRVFDSCVVIDKTLFNNMSLIERDIDIQIDKLFMSALSYHAGCPLLDGRIRFQSQPIILPYTLLELNALAKDHYAVKLYFNTRSGSSLGCAQFHVNYDGQVLT